MSESLQQWCLGTAAVIDTVLLLAMLERPNWRGIAIWMVWLVCGTWLWHVGTFAQTLLDGATSQLSLNIRCGAMGLMAAGLLLMPSATLHGYCRLYRTAAVPSGRSRPWLALCYLPLLALPMICHTLAARPEAGFLELVAPYKLPYLCWMVAVNVLFAVGLMRYARLVTRPRAGEFVRWMAVAFAGTAALNVLFILFGARVWPAAEGWLLTVVSLLPVAPVLLFAYYVMRFQFIPLVLERTLVYGALVAGLLLLHRLAVHDLETAVRQQYQLDLQLLEGIGMIALILAYQPLRRRVTEALRYLFGSPAQSREQNRRFAVRLAAQAGQPVQGLLDWFTESVREGFQFESAAFWLLSRDGRNKLQAGTTESYTAEQAEALHHELIAAELSCCTRSDAPTPAVLDLLLAGRASAAVRLEYRDLAGILLIGPQGWGQPPGDEELSTLVLLVEQLGVTLHNSLLQESNLAAERRLLQQEKLSTLGLLAGSIAHEVKNPLSSIKTIAAVLAEDLGIDSPHAPDVRVILGEIDRLALTTSQLLEIARPPRSGPAECGLAQALRPTLRILEHLARQQNVTIAADIDADLPPVAANEGALREIFFNLLANAVQAAGHGGRVSLAATSMNGSLQITIHNTGPAIPADVQGRLFEPFFTTKAEGTGLGLFIVGRRVRELGGTIACRSDAQRGTTFEITLPATEVQPLLTPECR